MEVHVRNFLAIKYEFKFSSIAGSLNAIASQITCATQPYKMDPGSSPG